MESPIDLCLKKSIYSLKRLCAAGAPSGFEGPAVAEARTLAEEREDAVAFLLPRPRWPELFDAVVRDGLLPRKTFSIGRAQDKRFYLEARKIRK